MNIGIIGTRGIPNNYGGFEQCAEYLALGLTDRGGNVTVYSSKNHPYQKDKWKEVNIIHCFDPEYKLGIIGQFIYDFNCIIDSRKRNFDVIIQLGYTSNSIWGWLLPKSAIITTNMDGLEWKRSKYSKIVQKFLLFAEWLAVKFSDYLIADSIGIQEYLFDKYKIKAIYIPYGAHLHKENDCSILGNLGLDEYGYNMLIARMEPENNIELILDGVVKSNSKRTFLVVGNYKNKFGQYIKEKYKTSSTIKFLGGIFDISKLNNLRYYSNLYFHGHSVGGTNPSLLEAMASGCLVCAHDNAFNRYILDKDAIYFKTVDDVVFHLQQDKCKGLGLQQLVENNRKKIAEIYNWNRVIDMYEKHLNTIVSKKVT